MYKNDGYVRRYSESFKLKVLDRTYQRKPFQKTNCINLRDTIQYY